MKDRNDGEKMGRFSASKLIILKVGTSSLVDETKHIDTLVIERLVKQIDLIKKMGKDVILVTSGAITVGASKLGIKAKTVPLKQACAAVGQASLINTYEAIFENYNMKVAQILVSHDDFDNRKRMLNLRNTLESLIGNGVVPIINENDALSIDEIKVGDNDTLAALIAATSQADLVILLSDIDGLYDKNPKNNSDARLVSVVEHITSDIEKMGTGSSSDVGTGGMSTKINAAKIATSAGSDMIIMNSSILDQVNELFKETRLGTLFKKNCKLSSRSHWMVYTSNSKGQIVLDKGACEACFNRKSLLAKGIKEIIGVFKSGSVVQIVDDEYEVIGKGIVNYSSDEIRVLKGHDTSEFISLIGYKNKDEIIHANDIVITGVMKNDIE